MKTILAKEKDINLLHRFNHKTFWGKLDSQNVLHTLIEENRKRTNSFIGIDVDGIKNMDTLFYKDVFVKLTESNKSNKNNNLFFVKINNEKTLFSLKETYKNIGKIGLVKTNEKLNLIGAVNFQQKVIFNKLVNYSPILPDIVKDELGIKENLCIRYFEELRNMGYANKTKNGLYKFKFNMDLSNFLRYYFKYIKLKFYTKPLFNSKLFSFSKNIS